MQIKVAVLINELNVRGGTHKQVLRFCQYLKKMRINYSIYTKVCDLEKTYPEFAEHTIITPPLTQVFKNTRSAIGNLINDYIVQHRLYKMIATDTNIVNVHDVGFMALMKHAIRDKKTVIWQVNDLPKYYNVGVSHKKQDGLLNKLKRAYANYVVKNVNVITVNVTKNKNRVSERFGRDATLLYCGVDVNNHLKMHRYKTNAKTRISLLSVGVFFPYRNYETLIDVMMRLKRQGVPAFLNIIGSIDLDYQYYLKIRDIIKEKGVEDCVKVWGQVNEELYNNVFNEADIFMFLNIDQSWGLAVFEAMSCGIPVIVSNSVGAVEVLENHRNAIIVEPHDAAGICSCIKRLIQDEVFYNRISYNAMKLSRKFEWDEVYSSRLLDVFMKECMKTM